MFRVALFSIVLTLATAPEASLLCQLSCHPSAAATDECSHGQAPATVVKSGDDCRLAALNVPGFIGEARGRAASPAAHAVAVPRYQLARPAIQPDAAESFAQRLALERRPLDTVLRL
ncbi:MAG: hypothetical protein ACRD3G_31790 [Vicinamibacterales bacterium]